MDTEPSIAEALAATAHPSLQNERQVIRSAGKQAIGTFLEAHNCFSVLRNSGKVVVFDTRIPIQLAFYALVEHDMPAAPLWDPALCQFVGLLTVTDFIDILRHYRQQGLNVASLATRPIAELLNDSSISSQNNSKNAFLSADTTTTLKQACLLLHRHSLDFLPIMYPEDMRVLAIVTYTNILEHLVTHFREQRRLFDDTIYDLNIGTYGDDLLYCLPTHRLADALEILAKHNLSALPILENAQTKRILGVYSRSDITFLANATDAQDALTNLNLTLSEVMQQQRTDMTTPDALHTCTQSHTLQSIFEYFAQLRFNRLFVLNEQDAVVGVVSARDLVAYFLED